MRLPDGDRSRAVLVGVGAYRHLSLLPGVHNGASALRQILTDPRFGSLKPEHCALLPEDASRLGVYRAITTAAQRADDMLLVYFAGHGLRGLRHGDLHLAVSETESDADYGIFTAISYGDVRQVILNSNALLKVVILDCCFSGRATGHSMSTVDSIAEDLEIEGVATLASVPANAESRILDGESFPAFTGRLLALLSNGVAGEPELLSLHVLYRNLRKVVKAAGLRLPQANLGALLDEFGLVRNRAWQPAGHGTVGELESVGAVLRDLLTGVHQYRQSWQSRVQRRGSGLSLAGVAHVIANYLWDNGERSEFDVSLPRRLKDRVSRALTGGSVSAETLNWFMEAFDMRSEDRDRLWMAFSSYRGPRGTTPTMGDQ